VAGAHPQRHQQREAAELLMVGDVIALARGRRKQTEAHGNRTLVEPRGTFNDRAALQRFQQVRPVRRPS